MYAGAYLGECFAVRSGDGPIRPGVVSAASFGALLAAGTVVELSMCRDVSGVAAGALAVPSPAGLAAMTAAGSRPVSAVVVARGTLADR